MVRAGTAKKRRRGTRPVKRKPRYTPKTVYLKPQIAGEELRQLWNPRLSAKENLAKLGLDYDVNDFARTENNGLSRNEDGSVKFFDLAAARQGISISADLDAKDIHKAISRNSRRKLMSDEDQSYIKALLSKHGENYKAMFKDLKTNSRQLTVNRLEKMAQLFKKIQNELALDKDGDAKANTGNAKSSLAN